MSYIPNLRRKYNEEIIPKLTEQFGYESVMEVPKLRKISINQGLGDATQDKKIVDNAFNDLAVIAGQKPVTTIAKKSVSNFKLREGMPIGCKVTLRKNRMYEFLERLIAVALPRVRDFRGINDKSFDGRGNYTLGITEHIIFPEIDMDKVTRINGMDITFVTTAQTDAEALALLKEFGMPFKNQ
ncbi:MAG: 50S ribosomal protein L5 [Saprospirales bacterium]|nr:MAG: 50S ribosomal protein L5 [Saprospirales bacterium]